MKVGDLVKVSILGEKQIAVIFEDSHTRWNGRLHNHIKTWKVLFDDGSIGDEFEIDLEFVNEGR